MLPIDYKNATLLGRVDMGEGPTPILVKNGEVFDVSKIASTSAGFAAIWSKDLDLSNAVSLGAIEDLATGKVYKGENSVLLSPIDLQCVKAAGVTFAVSAVERVIEERARGDANAAQDIRNALSEKIGSDIRSVVPGSEAAAKLKELLIADGLWSQYLEVAIGPDAEVFTKAPVLSSVGYGAEIGVRSDSSWNNPEPEVAVLVNPKGEIIGASLGNDVNLRCFEGRSALLLGKAKDNNASASLGPFVRLFDDNFTMDDVRNAELDLRIEGEEGYILEGHSSMSFISRDPTDLVKQTISQHQYPDGFILYTGTLFAPTQDRDAPGRGFTHKVGDIVKISSPKLGTLENRVVHCNDAPLWNLGIIDLMKNLSKRGLL